MNDQGDTDRTEARLRAALTAAAAVMAVNDAPERQQLGRVRPVSRGRGRWAPLAAAAGVVAIAAGTVLGAHLASHAGTRPPTSSGAAQGAAPTARPEFYLTATYPASGQNVLQFQVRRTNGGTVTGSRTISAANLGWGGYLAAGGDRVFYFSHYPCTTTAVPRTTFDRITITGSGRISGFAPVGRPVKGMVTTFAISPDGSRMAYNALPSVCTGGFKSTAAGSVSVMDLSTGAVRTWQDGTGQSAVSRLSWAPAGRTLVVDEHPRRLGNADLTVFGLDTNSGGGSLPAHSKTLLQQSGNCSTCVKTALAGPDGRLTELESQPAARGQTRVLVVSVPSAAGRPPTVLYRALQDAPAGSTELVTDAAGQWVLLWPAGPPGPRSSAAAGWISGGKLHPLPGVARIFPQGIAW